MKEMIYHKGEVRLWVKIDSKLYLLSFKQLAYLLNISQYGETYIRSDVKVLCLNKKEKIEWEKVDSMIIRDTAKGDMYSLDIINAEYFFVEDNIIRDKGGIND